ncbi:MAG: NAD(P)/FAD-dependent oxidoreductase [Cyanobacteria bacterium P01_H01_bin.15]
MNWDVIIIGSGIGGLTAGALLARYGQRVLICESHTLPGGAAHAFERRGFTFDSGPSFYAGIGCPSLNPLYQVLRILEEPLKTIPYDPLGHYHFSSRTVPIPCDLEKYQAIIAQFSRRGASELADFTALMLQLYDALKKIPAIALRSDWQLILSLWRYWPGLLKMLPQLGRINGSVGAVMDQTVRDPFVRRLIDLECFLLSGLKAHSTIAPEVAFMLGERQKVGVEYPVGGSGAIVEALIRGLEKWGGELQLNAHVEKILVRNGQAHGIKLRSQTEYYSPVVISNATLWDTYQQLLAPEDLPATFRGQSLQTPAIDSFMHLHLGLKAEGLEDLTGHHVVVHDEDLDLGDPGNTCMISIPTVWDSQLAPLGHHVVHVYSLESFSGWQRDEHYAIQKQTKAKPLYRALGRVIPDWKDRLVLNLVGTPLTHARYLRRHQGTYGPAIAAGNGLFPSCQTPIQGLYRVGDSTLPGIGVPAVAASGALCANTLVPWSEQAQLLAQYFD